MSCTGFKIFMKFFLVKAKQFFNIYCKKSYLINKNLNRLSKINQNMLYKAYTIPQAQCTL